MSGQPALRCLVISRPSVEGYPPVLNQVALLAEHGFHVIVADQQPGSTNLDLSNGYQLERLRLGNMGNSGGPLRRILNVVRFCKDARRAIRRLRPDWVIAYDPEACIAVGRSLRSFGGRLVWHFHETPMQKTRGLNTLRLANRFVYHNAELPDLIVFPDIHRANYFASGAAIDPQRVHIVMNCPRRLPHVPSFPMRQFLPAHLAPKTRLVVYSGSVGPDHGLETAVRSIPQWPKDTAFIVQGRTNPEYDLQLEALAQECGVAQRVIRLEYSPGFDIYARAHIGWTVNEHTSFNSKHSAGASNKRFVCMAVGTPQITDDGPGTREIFESGGCAICILPASVKSAAEAVNRLLVDENVRRQAGNRARQLHLERFNYEAEFQPVVEKMLDWKILSRT